MEGTDGDSWLQNDVRDIIPASTARGFCERPVNRRENRRRESAELSTIGERKARDELVFENAPTSDTATSRDQRGAVVLVPNR